MVRTRNNNNRLITISHNILTDFLIVSSDTHTEFLRLPLYIQSLLAFGFDPQYYDTHLELPPDLNDILLAYISSFEAANHFFALVHFILLA